MEEDGNESSSVFMYDVWVIYVRKQVAMEEEEEEKRRMESRAGIKKQQD